MGDEFDLYYESNYLGWIGWCLMALSAQIGYIVPCPLRKLIP